MRSIQLYKANRVATKNILAGGLHPKVKSQALDTIKVYYKAFGRFIISELRDSAISSPAAFATTKISKGIVGFYVNWR